jgi:hypothetical protein
MQKSQVTFQLSIEDRKTIDGIACMYACPFQALISLPFFIKDITPTHYIYLGWAIGQIQATEKTLGNFYQTQNPLSKCRAN